MNFSKILFSYVEEEVFSGAVEETFTQSLPATKVFLKFLLNSQEKHVPESPFDKVAGQQPETSLKQRLPVKCFSVNFAEFL